MRVLPCLFVPLLGVAMAPASWAGAPQAPLEEIIVTATLRAQPLSEVPASVSVLERETLADAGQQHFEDVLALVPNLNWAGGTSRPRYFQIRGIGEREQYEGAPNPSVGFLIDDVDFSGLGMPATLFDVDRIEVLRGPQGTRYGANALAGLIAVRTAEPGSSPGFSVEGSAGEFGIGSLGLAATAPVTSLDSSWRLAVQQYRSDGFSDNVYLDRHTNARDEFTGRAKWRWQAGDDTTVDMTLLRAELDNGYDAWAIDNSRRTLSDRPGEDSQRATGAAIHLTSLLRSNTLTVIGSHADSTSINSFDADWGNAGSWAPYTYDYFSRSERERQTGSFEVRLASPAATDTSLAWLGGVYVLDLKEDGRDLLNGEYADPSDPTYDGVSADALDSRYSATNLAVFGQLDGVLAPRWTWVAGLRMEQRTAHYRDAGIWDGAFQQTDLDARNRMAGGQFALNFAVTPATSLYGSVSRGYKAGGFNLGGVAPEARYFAPEYLWNLEFGAKAGFLEGRGYADVAVFYEARRDLQVRTGRQLDPANPGTYTFVTDNLDRGYNTGIEGTFHYFATPALELGISLGLLRTRADGGVTEEGVPVPGREQAHAPEYSASLFGAWRHASGFMARVDIAAKDDFYFDVAADHDRQAAAYTTANLKLGFEQPSWSAYLWVRNVFDEDYAVRGFYFYNEPPFYEKQLYIQHGEPRQAGITVRWTVL